jgi:hypothetical protein
MWKTLAPICAVFQVAALTGAACNGLAADRAKAERQWSESDRSLATGFVWMAPGPKRPCYLLGSQHSKPVDALPEVIWDRMLRAAVFVSESNREGLDVKSIIREHGVLPVGQSLDRILGPAHWRLLTRNLRGFPEAQLTRVRPWVADLILEESLQTSVRGERKGDTSMDEALAMEARDARKKMVTLDDESEFAELAEVMDERYLKYRLDHVAEIREAMARDPYATGNLAQIEEDLLGMVRLFPAVFEVMLWKRNRKWVRTLAPFLRRGDCFVVVGIGHFVGDEGLLALLRREGIALKRVGH